MINWGLVLVFVNHNSGKLWVCTSEQCGHVNLIIKVDRTGIGSGNGGGEDVINDLRCVIGWAFVHGSVEMAISILRPS